MKRGIFVLLGFVFLLGVFVMDSAYIEMTGNAVEENYDLCQEYDGGVIFDEETFEDYCNFGPTGDRYVKYRCEGGVRKKSYEVCVDKCNGGCTVLDMTTKKRICIEIDGGVMLDDEEYLDGCEGSKNYIRHCENGKMSDSESEYCKFGCADGACLSERKTNLVAMEDLDTSVIPMNYCNGCEVVGECFAYGSFKDSTYCSTEGFFASQLDSGYSCSNNYECLSESCIEGQCRSDSFWSRLADWIKGLFN